MILAEPGRFDLSSPASVDLLLAKARAAGPLAAVVHAMPLRAAGDVGLDPKRWASRIGPEVQGLFLLAKAAAPDLDRASKRGGGALIAATALGGAFGSVVDGPGDFFPGHGGVAGLVKTLAREWPSVRTRVVDFDSSDEPRLIADRLIDEALIDDGWSEVGYHQGRRIRLAVTPGRLDCTLSPRLALKPGEPVVITGGARGITAAVALELAKHWKPTLLLIGRSPLPPDFEDSTTAGIEATADLKAAASGSTPPLGHRRERRRSRPSLPGGPASAGDPPRTWRRSARRERSLSMLRPMSAIAARSVESSATGKPDSVRSPG